MTAASGLAKVLMDSESDNLTSEISDIVRDYQEPLLRYATRLLRNPDLAQDTVQDAFIRYLRYRSRSHETIENPKAWLYRVTHNLALDHIRRNQRHEGMREELTFVEAQRSTKGPYKQLANRDAEATAWRLLETMPEREQQIVALKVIDGRSYKEIAEIMGLTVTNVGFILHNTMKKLGKELKKLLTPE